MLLYRYNKWGFLKQKIACILNGFYFFATLNNELK